MVMLTMFAATSALDAESETLVNAALGALLRGNNTTISIAHRLSTIKRSDRIIVLSSDGKVAEQGTYNELSNNPNGAFSKLMEWQMSGGEPVGNTDEMSISPERRGPPTESEEVLDNPSEEDEGEDVDEEGLKERKGDETKTEAVLEKVNKQP